MGQDRLKNPEKKNEKPRKHHLKEKKYEELPFLSLRLCILYQVVCLRLFFFFLRLFYSVKELQSCDQHLEHFQKVKKFNSQKMFHYSIFLLQIILSFLEKNQVIKPWTSS